MKKKIIIIVLSILIICGLGVICFNLVSFNKNEETKSDEKLAEIEKKEKLISLIIKEIQTEGSTVIQTDEDENYIYLEKKYDDETKPLEYYRYDKKSGGLARKSSQ